jgi:phosphosulfolactate synthase
VGQIGPGFLNLPYRSPKPRSDGLTHVLDKGLSLVGLESFSQAARESIDIIKLGWGTAYVSDGVKAKVALCRSADIHLCPGGTLLEICHRQDRIDDYVRWLQRLGVTHVEVSNGALGMTIAHKRELIHRLAQEFVVLSECGSKNPAVDVIAASWVAEMRGDLDAGASLLIAEARESGTVGLYGPDGRVRAELVDALVADLPPDRIIFEAPARTSRPGSSAGSGRRRASATSRPTRSSPGDAAARPPVGHAGPAARLRWPWPAERGLPHQPRPPADPLVISHKR